MVLVEMVVLNRSKKKQEHISNSTVFSPGAFVCLCSWVAYIAHNMDPDQTAPLGEQSDQGSYCLLQ